MDKLFFEYLNQEKGVTFEVVTDLEKIKKSEIKRVAFYLREYQRYKMMNYQKILRWPSGIDPEKGYIGQKDKIKKLVINEVESNKEIYNNFGHEYIEAFNVLKTNNFDKVASNLFGYQPGGRYSLLPTAYGTIASPLDVINKTPMVFRLPEFTPRLNVFNTGKGRSPIEGLAHEIYAHALTAMHRIGTVIDDRLNIGTHAHHKERLMDLIGRTLLVRSGLMNKEDIAMQNGVLGSDNEIAKLVDNVYYASSDHDEGIL